MSKNTFAQHYLKLALAILWLLLIAAQCQTAPPTATPTPLPTPTPALIPPIQPGDGTDLIDRLLEQGLVRVGIRVWPEAEFSPPAFRGFSNAMTGGALNGFEIDIARLLARQLSLELELVEAYPPVIASGNWRGEWDIAMALLTPFDQPLPDAPAQQLLYSQPYGYLPMGILVPASQGDIQNFSQLAGRRVGVLEHSAYQRLLTPTEGELTVYRQSILLQPPPDLQPVAISNIQKAIRQLGQPPEDNSPQIDALFGPTPIFEQAINSGFPVQLAAEGAQVGIQPLVIAVAPQDNLKVDRLVAEINKALDRLQRSGALAEVYLRWYGQNYSRLPAAPLEK